MLNFPISKEEAEQTIISFLKKRLRTTPLSLIYKLFRAKKIKINGGDIRYYHYRLKEGDKVIINDNSLKVAESNNLAIPKKSQANIEIIYEDKNILIILKKHGISMLQLDKITRYYFYQQNPQKYQELNQKYFSFTAIHRLDKLTQGLVIYPKNLTAKRILYNAISDKEKITKKYLAVVENSAQTSLPDYISGYLWKNEPEQKMEFSPNRKKETSKQCAMEIKKIRKRNNRLLLEIILHTGRKHQIRAILSYLGVPIVGDKKYGSKIEVKEKIYLFAYKILFNNLSVPLSYLNSREFQIKGELEGLS
ncbi:12214_t:CDS:1 [Entrophospora sp. SA101]|nr:12214_t:CDS:1 [Entrophospora sp. SA101]CAJ0749194.1 12214_t:CDS:1 [Entrophospora sp. SA101]CAJ0837210.1 3316_t:CDS:1 [Entrophospora sp. SA101]